MNDIDWNEIEHELFEIYSNIQDLQNICRLISYSWYNIIGKSVISSVFFLIFDLFGKNTLQKK